jgi:hypothetical protein
MTSFICPECLNVAMRWDSSGQFIRCFEPNCEYIIQFFKFDGDAPTDQELQRAIKADKASSEKLDLREIDPRFSEAGNGLLKELLVEPSFPAYMDKVTRFLQENANYQVCDVCGDTGIEAVRCCDGKYCVCEGRPIDFDMECSKCKKKA